MTGDFGSLPFLMGARKELLISGSGVRISGGPLYYIGADARVAELADALDLGSSPLLADGGSSPPSRTQVPLKGK